MTDSSYGENKAGRVLKTDVLGRVKTGVRQREAILDEFERSGLSGTKFAAVAGVNYQTFASWVQKRRKATGAYPKEARQPRVKKATGRAAATPPALGWVEAVVDGKGQCASDGSTVLRLELPCGASMRITDEAQAVLAAQLLKAWQNPPVR
jgi:hypothetical protein